MPGLTKLTPEQLLQNVQAEEEHERRGRLKIFLGYAAGVGKSFRMFDEGRRRRERGQDVVVGAKQQNASPEAEAILKALPVIPMRSAGSEAVMDVDAILRRAPQVCLVDGLAYDNPPGSRHAHRWQEVEELLARGISVMTTVNLQYVEERRAEVERIRGKQVSVTVPEQFLRQADEIVVVDAPADDCLERTGGQDMTALPTDRQQKLSQLREIALLLAADVIDDQLEKYLARHGLAQSRGMQERVLVALTPRANAARMIERAKLVRDRFHGELFVVYVGQPEISADDQARLEQHLARAREAGAQVELLEGEDPVAVILQFAHAHGVTQIFVGHSLRTNWLSRWRPTATDRLIRYAEGIDVKLFPH